MIKTFFKDSNIDLDRIKVINTPNCIYVDGYFFPEDEKCPICNSSDLQKNGHIKRTVKHCVYYSSLILVTCHFQLYCCKNCNHKFQEKNTFSPPNISLSYESIFAILEKLQDPTNSFESIAKDMHISRQNVLDVFDKFYTYSPSDDLPEIMSFDEKHIGKAISDHKYLFIILDWKQKKIYNILESRDKKTIWNYFSSISREKRLKVKYITMDMWETYRDVSKVMFPNAKIAVDSFHVMQNVNRAMNKVRCSIMAKYNEKTENLEDNNIYYYFLKKYDYFFTMEFDKIPSYSIKVPKLKSTMYKSEIIKFLLSIDDRLALAYKLTSKYREFNKTANFQNCSAELEELIDLFINSKLDDFIKVGRTLINWKNEIINSFITIDECLTIPNTKDEIPVPRRLSNGPIEGINSIIEQIKINGKGYKNFKRFKYRVIYAINKDLTINGKKVKLYRTN